MPRAQYEIAKVAIVKGLHVFAERPLLKTHEESTCSSFCTKKGNECSFRI